MAALFSTRALRFNEHIAYPDLDIPEGAVTFISGPSGCGKSTLLRLLNGTRAPLSGQVLFRSAPIRDAIALRREAPLVAQATWLFPGSIRENFQEYRSYVDAPAIPDAAIREALCLCAAPELPLDADTAVLSGGERHRVFLAVYLSLHPSALLLDEPTAALDAATARRLLSNLCSLFRKDGRTLLIVSHDAALAAEFAGNTIALKGGKD